MTTLRKLAWIELKLFLREPTTVMLAFVMPVVFLVILAGVFGNQPETTPDGKQVWRGVGPTDYYVPGYLGLIAASVGFVSVPVHLAAYREQGILRRLHASAVSVPAFLASQILAALVMATVSALVLSFVGLVGYGIPFPRNPLQLTLAFSLGTSALIAIGLLMGSFLASTRSAQGIGLMLFFVLWMLSGTGPPIEAMTSGMRTLGDLNPMMYVVALLQDGWLGFGWDAAFYAVTLAFAAAALLISLRLFRWE